MKTMTLVLRGGWLLFFLLIGQHLPAQIIISQYYEGLNNDKFIELTNVSATLFEGQKQALFICVFSNEKAENPQNEVPGLSTQILLNIAPGASTVYKNPLAQQPEYAVNIATGGLIGAFNGNDLIILSNTKDETAWDNRIDVLGEAGNWGEDISLVRNTSISQPSNSFIASTWTPTPISAVDMALQDTPERLGSHMFNCSPPTGSPIDLIVTDIMDYSANLHWSEGDGTNSLVIVKPTAELTDFPENGISYSASSDYGMGQPWEDGYVVYDGFENEISLTGLTPNQQYFIFVFEFSCTPTQYLSSLSSNSFTTLMPVPRLFVTPETPLDFGIVRKSLASQSFSINVMWQNLNGDIQMETSGPFEISFDNEIWSKQLNISEQTDGGTEVYVRCLTIDEEGSIDEFLSVITPGASQELALKAVTIPNMWINEFHYENQGGDENEFIEIAIKNPEAFPLNLLHIYLYNGSDGQPYDNISVDEMTSGERINNFQVFTWQVDNIQNGQPGNADGIAIGIDTVLIQFLSYEGTFTGSEGLTSNVTSEDIGAEESDDFTLPTESIQLMDENGAQLLSDNSIGYSTFTWSIDAASPGFFNQNQSLPVSLLYFNGEVSNGRAYLKWMTLSELHNHGFEIEKSLDGVSFNYLDFVPGMGTTNEPTTYSWKDKRFEKEAYYRLRQIDYDGVFAIGPVIHLKIAESFDNGFLIAPQPVTDRIFLIDQRNSRRNHLNIALLTIQGKKILDTSGDLSKIIDDLNKQLPKLQTGFYILKLNDLNFQEKLVFLKL